MSIHTHIRIYVSIGVYLSYTAYTQRIRDSPQAVQRGGNLAGLMSPEDAGVGGLKY